MITLPLAPGLILAAALALGLALSPASAATPTALAIGALGAPLLWLARRALFGRAQAARAEARGRRLAAAGPIAAGLTLAMAGLWLGLLIGELRLRAIDGGAFKAAPGAAVVYRGHLTEPPRPYGAGVRLHLNGPEGRVVAFADSAPAWARTGAGVEAHGIVEPPPAWLANELRRRGIAVAIKANRLLPVAARGGLAGALDRIRERALAGLQAGMPPREAALASGFVLGQDEEIDEQTKEVFRRSGLAHLLAVSGQNVMLLIALGSLPLILLGAHLRHRVWPLALLALLYLPLAGGGPSIQRATVMGLAMLLALRLGRPGHRLFALLAAADLTLLANPRMTGDIGWQLSFAATVAIMAMASDLRRALLAAPALARWGRTAGPLADGAAVTIAATLATAPLMAHHFESLPLGTVSANLLALPAVAPVMWLGMLAGLAGQLPGAPTEAINLLNAALISYIAEVAELIGSLEAGVVGARLGPTWLTMLCEAAAIGLGWRLAAWLADRAPSAEPGSSPGGGRAAFWAGRALAASAALAVAAPLAAALAPSWLLGEAHGPPDGLRIVALDVGQGDAILIQERDLSLLIDAGPPDAGIGRALARYSVDRLEAVLLSHGDLDHVGGLPEIASRLPIDRLYAAGPLGVAAAPRATGGPLRPTAIAAGRRLRLGGLRLDALWPPADIATSAAASGDRNRSSLVLLLRWRGFSALFTGDAEAEAAAFPAPDVDLLKLAHHGSADAGLPALLQSTTPALALISVGADNRYGHPAPSTLAALAAKSVPTHRTDREGDLVLELADDRGD